MRRGLSDILSTEVLLFVWDQCVLTSFDLVIPYAAACVLALLDEPLQFFLRDNEDPQVHEALMRLGKDLQLVDVEACFRRVVPKIAPDARELTDAISARPPPGLLVEASLPGAAALGGLADVVVDALADGAGLSMHGIVAASRGSFVVLRHRRDSSPGEGVVGGLWSKFEPIRTAPGPVPEGAGEASGTAPSRAVCGRQPTPRRRRRAPGRLERPH